MTKSYAHTLLMAMTLPLTLTLMTTSETAAEPGATTITFRRLAIKPGEQVPGMPQGITMGRPTSVVVGPDGRAAYIAGLNGTGVKGTMQAGNDSVPNHEALFVETNDGFKPLLRLGDAVLPDHPDLQVSRIQLCSAGEGNVVAVAHLGNKPRIPNPYCAVFTNQDGEFQPVLQTGVSVADGKLTRFDDMQRSSFRPKGHMTFRSRLQSSGSDSHPAGIAIKPPPGAKPDDVQRIAAAAVKHLPTGLWSGIREDVHRIAESGCPVPDKPGFVFQKIGTFAQNARGDVAFEASMSKANNIDFSCGVWRVEGGGKPRLVSNNIDGLPKGTNFKGFESVELNDKGQLVVWTVYEIGKGSDKTRGTAILLIEGDRAKVLFKSGDSIPGTSTVVTGFHGLKLSSTGMVATTYRFGEQGKPQKKGLLVIDPANQSEAKSIMAQGAAAPIAKGDVTYGQPKPHFKFIRPNTVAFYNVLSDRSTGVFTSVNGESAQPLFMEGMELEIDGNRRSVEKISQLGNSLDGNTETGYLPVLVHFASGQKFKRGEREVIIAELPAG